MLLILCLVLSLTPIVVSLFYNLEVEETIKEIKPQGLIHEVYPELVFWKKDDVVTTYSRSGNSNSLKSYKFYGLGEKSFFLKKKNDTLFEVDMSLAPRYNNKRAEQEVLKLKADSISNLLYREQVAALGESVRLLGK